MSDLSFSQRLKAGMSKPDLMKYYCLTEGEYDRVIRCLEDLKARPMKNC